ncbi:aromatic amino acid ammonia-lyase [Marisediminicola senii]|uniref:aromatic amino acid ammonia-lyase n=1 Tax=Marisediminicola senii TaxID=2711233 RepID=UPI0013EB740B|nr:aromatic amino acid ammonia-lyase [Marisediminicola senii]
MTAHPGALVIDTPADLDAAGILRVADGVRLSLSLGLLHTLQSRRALVLRALEAAGPVYGVTTGMGAASEIRLDAAAQALHQNTLMLARAVGSEPWLTPVETRAVIAARLRTFLTGDAGASPALCSRLVDLLNADLLPAIPRTGIGTAGEIIPLAHLGGCVTGSGEFLRPSETGGTGESGGTGSTIDATEALAAAGLTPLELGPKEGVAMLEGVPVTAALAILASRDALAVAAQSAVIVAAELVVVGATRDPLDARLARGDNELGDALAAIRRLAGEPLTAAEADASNPAAAALQAPVSFRVTGHAIAHHSRTVSSLDRAIARALEGVTDSPAFVDGAASADPASVGVFLGTAGFDGFDLAAHLDALRLSTIHLAELSATRLHRMLDDRITSLPRQLSAQPGLNAGMAAVHKRAVGVTHAMVGAATPVSVGTTETSLGQEDAQSYSVEAAVRAIDAGGSAREVLACELLAVMQAVRLRGLAAAGATEGVMDAAAAPLPPELAALLAAADAALPAGVADRPFGRDIYALAALLDSGWGANAL